MKKFYILLIILGITLLCSNYIGTKLNEKKTYKVIIDSEVIEVTSKELINYYSNK